MRYAISAPVTFRALAAVDFAPAVDKQRPEIDGRWVAVNAERNGQPANDIVGHGLVFENGNFVIRSPDGLILHRGTFQAAVGAKGAIDFAHATGALQGKTWMGIFARDGDTLTICDNGANLAEGRPVKFRSKPGSGDVLVVFRRVRP